MKTTTLNSRVSASVATCPTQQLPEVYKILQEPRVSLGTLSEPHLACVICALLIAAQCTPADLDHRAQRYHIL